MTTADFRMYCWAISHRWRAQNLASNLKPFVEPWCAALGVLHRESRHCAIHAGAAPWVLVLAGQEGYLPDLSELPVMTHLIEQMGGERLALTPEELTMIRATLDHQGESV
jgi:hypothetical protein